MSDEQNTIGNQETVAVVEPVGLKLMIRALRYRNYRLFFIGQSISLIGSWMQRIAIGWLVYRLTNSMMLLGIVMFTSQIPVLLFAPLAGVLADRWNRHRLLILTQSVAMIQALVFALLILTGVIAIWHIIVLGIILGIVHAFDMPIRQAFVIEMVGKKEDFGNAIALNSSVVNVARLLGPSIAGVIVATAGEGLCFLINGITYFPVIGCLLAMKITPLKKVAKHPRVLHQLKEGFSYAFRFVPIRSVLLLLSLTSIMGLSHSVLMPVFAKDILHGDARTFGFLVGASGIGAITGALYLAYRKSVIGLVEIIATAAAIMGFGLLAFSLSRVFALSLLLMTAVGFGMMVQMTASNTILQTIVDDDKRGRVMSLFAMSLRGMVPFGSLLLGSMASLIGASITLFIAGGCCVLAAIVFARQLPTLRKITHPIYDRMGITK